MEITFFFFFNEPEVERGKVEQCQQGPGPKHHLVPNKCSLKDKVSNSDTPPTQKKQTKKTNTTHCG